MFQSLELMLASALLLGLSASAERRGNYGLFSRADISLKNAAPNNVFLVSHQPQRNIFCGANPGSDSGANPGSDSGANPGSDSGANPGSDPGANTSPGGNSPSFTSTDPSPNAINSGGDPSPEFSLDVLKALAGLARQNINRLDPEGGMSDTGEYVAMKSNKKKVQLSEKGNQTVHTVYSGVSPVINVTWGNRDASSPGQQFVSFVDTGSSDTYAVASNFQCVSRKEHTPLPQSACRFGNLYDTRLGQFQNVSREMFKSTYFPEQDIFKGSIVTAPITVAGITVPDQKAALIEYAALVGDGTTSGLLGLGYPNLTLASDRATGANVPYDPWLTSAVKKGLINDAVFTLALERVPPGVTSVTTPAGALAIGGLVPASLYSGTFTSVPIEPTKGTPNVLSFYSMTHSLKYGPPGSGPEKHQTVGPYQSYIDSGTAANFVPTAAAKAINEAFDPPATFNSTLNYWTVDCNAKAPYVSFVIGGVEMPMDPRDMTLRSLNLLPGYENVCFSVFADGGNPQDNSKLMVIGEAWQLSHVVSYDQKNNMLHIAQRSEKSVSDV